jgi:hypothetical protein
MDDAFLEQRKREHTFQPETAPRQPANKRERAMVDRWVEISARRYETRMNGKERFRSEVISSMHASPFHHMRSASARSSPSSSGACRSNSETYCAVYSGKECPIHLCNRVIMTRRHRA